MPALPVIDRIDDDVRAVMDDLLGQVVQNSQSTDGNLFDDAFPLGDCMDLDLDDDLGIDPPAADEVSFPTEISQTVDRFTNFDESTYDDGYDSEGGQPFMADELIVDDADAYVEEPITPAAQLPPPPLPPPQLTELITTCLCPSILPGRLMLFTIRCSSMVSFDRVSATYLPSFFRSLSPESLRKELEER
jgi:hypothetical protein